jgi:hypothetical protein
MGMSHFSELPALRLDRGHTYFLEYCIQKDKIHFFGLA